MLSARRPEVRPEIAREQCGCQENDTSDILRRIIERPIEIHQDLYLCFIDYTQVFDIVQHEEMLKMICVDLCSQFMYTENDPVIFKAHVQLINYSLYVEEMNLNNRSGKCMQHNKHSTRSNSLVDNACYHG